MIRSAATILFATVMGLSLGACNDTLASTGADAAVGVYTLQTIDGQSLPVIVDQQGNDIAEITQGTVTLDADGSFADVTELSITQSGVVSTETDAAVGAWALSGRTVQFVPNDGSGVYEMTWDGQDQLTQSFNGSILVYQRQP
jgi:hypothetical protein